MRGVIQRVKSANVKVNGNIVGNINSGLLVFLGVEKGDEQKDLEYIIDKVIYNRIFEDEQGKMNLSLMDINGELLVVSQFTLCGDCRKGRRPSFSNACAPDVAKFYYNSFIERLSNLGVRVQTGVFQAHMEVELVNDGPVTLLLDSKKNF